MSRADELNARALAETIAVLEKDITARTDEHQKRIDALTAQVTALQLSVVQALARSAGTGATGGGDVRVGDPR